MRAFAALALLAACDAGPAVDCESLDLEVPRARGEVQGVWDAGRERLVVFGGDRGVPEECFPQTDFVGETWAFYPSCGSFDQLGTEGAPPARGRHASALDAARERMIVHGGRFREGTSGEYTLRGDTWALDLATDTWAELSAGGPPARTNHVGVVAGDRFVLWGGNASTDGASFQPLDDLWALDLTTNEWAELEPGNDGPRARLFHAATLSADASTLYVYGGGGRNAFFGPFFGDLWALDLDDLVWTELHDGTGDAPRGRIWANLLADPERDRLILWAGHDDGTLGNTNQLWSFDLVDNGWTQLEEGDVHDQPADGFCDFPADFVVPDLDAPERRNAGAAAVTDDGELIVFGGKSDCGLLNDVWTRPLGGGPWQERSVATAGEICQRAFAECETLCF